MEDSYLAILSGSDMDIATLTAFISPFLPSLLKLGDKVAGKATETIAGKFGEAAWGKAQTIWAQLRPKVEAKEAALEAVTDVAMQPEDPRLQVALEVQLEKLLKQDEALATAIAEILQENSADGKLSIQIVQNVMGNQNQTIGQMTGGQADLYLQGNLEEQN